MIEIEKKYRVKESDFPVLKEKLKELKPETYDHVFEENYLFDSPNYPDKIFRLRKADSIPYGNATFFTYKEPHKNSEGLSENFEIEFPTSYNRFREFLEALGFTESVAYQKERQTLRVDTTLVNFDKLAFGHFVEIEGTEESIRSIETHLGLGDRVELRSYPTLASICTP